MHPLPSLSYILNVHLSLCSSLPLRTKFKAATYSRKSMVLSCAHEEKALNFLFYVLPRTRQNLMSRFTISTDLSANYFFN